MKKFSILFLTCLLTTWVSPLLSWSLWNACNPSCTTSGDNCCGGNVFSNLLSDVSVEARVAYYHPCSKRLRRIYSNGWPEYQVELSKGMSCNWRIWAGVGGFLRKGESIGFHDDTKISLIPVSCGLKYLYPISSRIKVYLGGAASYSFLHIEDHSEYVRQNTYKRNWGGLFQSGVYYYFTHHFFVSAFADYFFQRFHFSDEYLSDSRYIEKNDLNMSGYKVGIGIGETF